MPRETQEGFNPDETRIDPVDAETTKIESENNLSLEDLVKARKEMGYGAMFENQLKEVERIERSIEEEKEKLITSSNNFIELYAALNRIENLNKIDPGSTAALIAGSKDNYDMPKLRHLITQVRAGKIESDYITSRLGLRSKVEELIAAGNK